MTKQRTSTLDEIKRLVEADNLAGLSGFFADQKDGTSEAAVEAVRVYIQCSEQIHDPDLKPSSGILELIFSELKKRKPPQDELDLLMGEAIYGQQWKVIPYLHELGARREDTNCRRLIITHLGRGQWTYPELLSPDLLDSPEDIATLGRQMFQGNGPTANPLSNDHIERFIGFIDNHAQNKKTVCSELSKSLSSVLFDIATWKNFEAIPNAMNGIKLLMAAELIDENTVKENEFLRWDISDKFYAELAHIRAEILDENTPQSSARTIKSIRL